jgi:hypothetical protein
MAHVGVTFCVLECGDTKVEPKIGVNVNCEAFHFGTFYIYIYIYLFIYFQISIIGKETFWVKAHSVLQG